MFYHPRAHAIGVRDVAAAWLICLAVAATGIACAAFAAAPEDPLAAAGAVSPDRLNFFAGPRINGGVARSPSHQHA